MSRKIRITQTGSPIGRPKDQRASLVALGLNKMHRSRELEETPVIKGLVNKVGHLIKVEEIK